MDFRQTTQNSGRPAVVTPTAVAPEHKEEKERSGVRGKFSGKWTQILTLVVLVGTAVLLACIALAFTHSNNTNEVKYVTSDKYQAVFLNNGQVYFGKVNSLNDKYVRMTDVFYLTQSGDSSSSNYSLVKLGCQQIHDPSDQMVINRDQVTFWENLQDNGKVVTSINQFKKQNPNGPDCSQVSNQTQASGTTTQGGSSSTSTGTTNSTSNTTK